MNEADEVRLRDMLDAACKALEFAESKTRQNLDTDDMFAFALVRAIEIVGEAAARVSQETRGSYPQIRWTEIIGMRNKIVHDYLSVDNNIVWDVTENDLPPLIQQLESILPAEKDRS
jgi:uncharacterized protein with HEPN domain